MISVSKVDKNQGKIVKIFRSLGCTVQCLHAVGMGCPDILVGYKGINLLVEIKNDSMPLSARKLTPSQQKWHGNWLGQVCTVKDDLEATALIKEVNIKTQINQTIINV